MFSVSCCVQNIYVTVNSVLFSLFFYAQFNSPNDGVTLPLHLLLITPPLQLLTCYQCHLWVDCCIASWNGSNLRPRPSLKLLIFNDVCVGTKTMEPVIALPHPMPGTLHGPMGSHGAMGWGHRYSTHRDKGQSHWKVRELVDHLWLVCVCCVYF